MTEVQGRGRRTGVLLCLAQGSGRSEQFLSSAGWAVTLHHYYDALRGGWVEGVGNSSEPSTLVNWLLYNEFLKTQRKDGSYRRRWWQARPRKALIALEESGLWFHMNIMAAAMALSNSAQTAVRHNRHLPVHITSSTFGL